MFVRLAAECRTPKSCSCGWWCVVCPTRSFPRHITVLPAIPQTAFIQLMQLTAFGNLMLAAFIILESRYRLYLKLDRR